MCLRLFCRPQLGFKLGLAFGNTLGTFRHFKSLVGQLDSFRFGMHLQLDCLRGTHICFGALLGDLHQFAFGLLLNLGCALGLFLALTSGRKKTA